jgi:hypothetical protein
MGRVTAEVLVCEFVTPKLYRTWENSFPETLVQAAKQRGYEKCIAIKRFGAFEVVDFDPTQFVDGQWGNMIFASAALLEMARDELHRIALGDEKRMVTIAEEKEALMLAKAARIEYLTARMERLGAKVTKQRAKEQELREKIAHLREKTS